MNRLSKASKAIRELGLPKLWRYAVYQFGLRSGHYRRATPARPVGEVGLPGLPPVAGFPAVSPAQRDLALAAADEIRQGKIRLFGGEPVPLELEAGASSQHWTVLERTSPDRDLKLGWEPGRFGWALTLARAYAFSGEAIYARDFWDKTRHFLTVHPPNHGRQWQSAQEVAIRLMALVFCDRVFAASPESTPENRQRLWQAVAEHAQRIPPTLVYARAQNNNHLLSEAAGLYTAGLYLPQHPQANDWRELGWRWLNWGFQHQISEFGTYVQHSANYHRLMLQVALFTDHLRRTASEPDWPPETQIRLAAANRWLWALTDPETGKAPNLGANDGAYLFPLTHQPFDDFRPVVDAAAKAFLNLDIYAQPQLNELADWFGLSVPADPEQSQPQAPDMLRVESDHGRAFLHTAHYADRPSHADQLHADLWWRGVNVALDPGTYQYNAPAPWDNALMTTRVHNTLTLDGQDQMQRAGRFLWLDWAQAEILAYEMDNRGRITRLVAEHDGYHRLGVLHQRELAATKTGWTITDTLLPFGEGNGTPHDVRLTWLLPDWGWEWLPSDGLHLTGPDFSFTLMVEGTDELSLFRAGERLSGTMDPEPTWGWVSPTYAHKEPVLMVLASAAGKLPLTLITRWQFAS